MSEMITDYFTTVRYSNVSFKKGALHIISNTNKAVTYTSIINENLAKSK